MRILFLLCLLFSTSVFAQRKMTRESFMVSVRPVLNGIVSDFYQMVGNFPDFPREIVPVVEQLNSLTPDKETLRVNCPRLIDSNCKDSLNRIREKLRNIKSLSLILMSHQKVSQSLHISTLAGQRLISEFDSKLEEVKGLLDNTSFVMAASIPQRKETFTILKDLDELNSVLSIAIVEFIPYSYKEDFRQFFFNFIHPIQQHIPKQNNYQFFSSNMQNLNFSINLLNMTLTKKKKTPEGMASYLATIHNRWNSILRYYF